MNPDTPTPQPQSSEPGVTPFAGFLASGGLALFDGAMGTTLYARGSFINRAFEELNLTKPALVQSVHADYLAAGAEVLETNTFAANRARLSPYGLAEEVAAINAAAVEIARAAAAGRAWVAGAIGPLGIRIEPFGPTSLAEARQVFSEQAEALEAGGVDLFLLETFGNVPELMQAVAAVKGVTRKPIIAQVAVAKRGVTREGMPIQDAAVQLAEAGVDAVGVNCSEALSILDALERLREAVDLPLSAQPNAGQPHTVDGRNIYLASPEYLAAWARRAARAGARLLGGCCGTTPAHIEAVRQALREEQPAQHSGQRIAKPRVSSSAPPPVPSASKSTLAASLLSGKFVTGVELPLPTGWVPDRVLAQTARLAEAGVNFVAFPDGPRTEARMSPIAMAQVSLTSGDIEPLVHYSCRDRRLSRIQSDLLGACAVGIANLLVVTGEPQTAGVDAKPDLDVDSIGAVNLVNALNHGQDRAGNFIGPPTRFFTGVRLDPTNFDMQRELNRYHWKLDAGADFALTSPVFDPTALQRLLTEWQGRKVPVIATVWPLRSAREAEFFEQELAEVPVPPDIVARMQAAEESGTARDEGIAIARELVAQLRPLVQGIQVVTPELEVGDALLVLG